MNIMVNYNNLYAVMISQTGIAFQFIRKRFIVSIEFYIYMYVDFNLVTLFLYCVQANK